MSWFGNARRLGLVCWVGWFGFVCVGVGDSEAKQKRRVLQRRQASSKKKTKRHSSRRWRTQTKRVRRGNKYRASKPRVRVKKTMSYAIPAFVFREVKRRGRRRYRVSSRVMQYYLQRLPMLGRLTLMEQAVRGDLPMGFRIAYLSKHSPVRLLGLRERDIITSVNGYPLRSFSQVLRAYMALRNVSKYKVGILRGQRRFQTRVELR